MCYFSVSSIKLVSEFSRQDQFLLTFGKNYIAHSGEKAELYCDEYDHQFEKRIETHAYHDYYYINANILSLLTHLPLSIIWLWHGASPP